MAASKSSLVMHDAVHGALQLLVAECSTPLVDAVLGLLELSMCGVEYLVVWQHACGL